MTDSLSSRLVRCFAATFPEIAEDRIQTSTPDSVARWDSFNHVDLIRVVEEEFRTSIPEAAAGELLSFRAFESYLESRFPSK
jgi:acyl carrier protein